MTRAIALIFLLAACSDSREVLDELPNSSLAGAPRADVSESRMDAPVARAVTIGEDGPRLDACGGMGQVLRTGAGGQPLRAAPFGDAKVLATLNEGDRAYICTRSLDQKWLGVVLAPPPAADNCAQAPDCGVSSPVDRKQPYDGPCVSGWVASAYVRLIAG
ncbi:MAG: hypothetical protein ACOY4N_03135 [Pseudomonadota bacterium]|nr:MAG: hypothetical protein ABS86_04305 [Sphingobium sp. SCN 64-10]